MQKTLQLCSAMLPLLGPLSMIPNEAYAGSNFIQNFVDAKGGCRGMAPLLTFENGVHSRLGPFGKEAEKWSDEDLATLKQTMAECVRNPNGFDVAQQRTIYTTVTGLIDQGRQSQQKRESRIAAQAEQRRLQETARVEGVASSELQSLSGHIMSPAEIDRAQQLGKEFAALSPRVDGLLEAQAKLKQAAATNQKQEKERREPAHCNRTAKRKASATARRRGCTVCRRTGTADFRGKPTGIMQGGRPS